MMNNTIETLVREQFSQWKNGGIRSMTALPPTASQRRYFRIESEGIACMGVYNPDADENAAYIDYTRQFLAAGLPVPRILFQGTHPWIYFVEDLGNDTLFTFLQKEIVSRQVSDRQRSLYRQVLRYLIRFQRVAQGKFDYTHAFPIAQFDGQGILWDLNHFKYYFLKLAQIPFREDLLEKDFQELIRFLSSWKNDFFMFRDFQSRNIMLKDGQLYFIDFQGGRKGPLAYDLASLLFDSKADLPEAFREELLDLYIHETQSMGIGMDAEDFYKEFYAFALIRNLQSLGTYGLRGLYEKKQHFIDSIPYGIRNLAYILQYIPAELELPHLRKVFQSILESHWAEFPQKNTVSSLCMEINSFSFKQGLPADASGNGGGFIFDCRGLPNPGRYPEYRQLTGQDAAVLEFFSRYPEIDAFVEKALECCKLHIENFMERGFEHLQVNFGCTGGQHRSVYCAELFARKVRQSYPVQVKLRHIAQEK